MTEVWSLDYTALGVASSDVYEWYGTGVAVSAQPTPDRSLRFQAAAGSGRYTTRDLVGLTIGTEYTVRMDVVVISAGSWTVTAGGVAGALTAGVNERTFTATTTEHTLRFDAVGTDVAVTRLASLALSGVVPEPEPPSLSISGSGLRLRDKVEIVTADTYEDAHGNTVYDWGNPIVVGTLPAYVGYTTTSLFAGEDGRNAFVEELRAITPAFDFDPVAHRLRWKGETYLPNGPALLRMRNGRDHHLTIPIKAVNG